MVAQDDRFSNHQTMEKEGSVSNMCEFLDKVENRGIAKGEERASMEIAKEMYSDGMSIELISKYVKYPVETVKEWLGIAA